MVQGMYLVSSVSKSRRFLEETLGGIGRPEVCRPFEVTHHCGVTVNTCKTTYIRPYMTATLADAWPVVIATITKVDSRY